MLNTCIMGALAIAVVAILAAAHIHENELICPTVEIDGYMTATGCFKRGDLERTAAEICATWPESPLCAA